MPHRLGASPGSDPTRDALLLQQLDPAVALIGSSGVGKSR
jgi:hypothetical protein